VIIVIVRFLDIGGMVDHHCVGTSPESRSGDVYSLQHYVIKFVSDLRHVGGFLTLLRFPPPIKLIATI
jgi:hypothetical protein